MTTEQAIRECEFWTTTVAETVAWGSSTRGEIADAFNCTVSVAREAWTNPSGPRNYDIKVARWLVKTDPVTGEIVKENGEVQRVENPVYAAIVAEIERRKAA